MGPAPVLFKCNIPGKLSQTSKALLWTTSSGVVVSTLIVSPGDWRVRRLIVSMLLLMLLIALDSKSILYSQKSNIGLSVLAGGLFMHKLERLSKSFQKDANDDL